MSKLHGLRGEPLQSELLKKSTRYQPVLLLIKLRLVATLLLVQIVIALE